MEIGPHNCEGHKGVKELTPKISKYLCKEEDKGKTIHKMDSETLQEYLGKTDVYVLDQFMKGRFKSSDKMLDAGCGNGRHLAFFHQLGYEIHGIDINQERVAYCKHNFASIADNISHGDLSKINYEDECFEHVISSAVLHFSTSVSHFKQLFSEHIRVLKKGGSLFIRMTSRFGLHEKDLIKHDDGIYTLPEGHTQFLISYDLIKELLTVHNLTLLEPIKTVNVSDLRAMAVIVFQKN